MQVSAKNSYVGVLLARFDLFQFLMRNYFLTTLWDLPLHEGPKKFFFEKNEIVLGTNYDSTEF